MSKFYNLGRASTKEVFTKILEESHAKKNQFDKFLVEIKSENTISKIILNTPIKKTDLKKWTKIKNKWGEKGFNKWIASKDISEELRKIKKDLEIIESKIKTNNPSLREETPFSEIAIYDDLVEIQNIYKAKIDQEYEVSLPSYRTFKKIPCEFELIKFLGSCALFIENAGLLGRMKENSILEASQEYKLKDKLIELDEQLDEFYELDPKSKKYKDWEKGLSEEVDKILGLIQEKEKQKLSSIARVTPLDQSIPVSQTSNFDQANIITWTNKSSEMLKKLNNKKKFQRFMKIVINPKVLIKKRKGKYECKEKSSDTTGTNGKYFKIDQEKLAVKKIS